MRLLLPRDDQNAARTFGAFVDDTGGFIRLCETLELPWRNNQRNVSCIPAGTYRLEYKWSEKHQRMLWHICDVPDRDDTEIHIGNSVKNTLGCVLCGSTRDGDDVDDSTAAFDRFEAHMQPYQATGATLVVTDPAPRTYPS